MHLKLNSYLPKNSVQIIQKLISEDDLSIIIKRERKSRHGDYRKLKNGKHLITINENLNQYRFLITLVHEIAHYYAFKLFGGLIKPHGNEWKNTYRKLLIPLLKPDVFPKSIISPLAKFIKKPKASTDSSFELSLALKTFDLPNNKTYIFDLDEGTIFKISDGRQFRKGKKIRTRFECKSLECGRLYSFSSSAQVDLVQR